MKWIDDLLALARRYSLLAQGREIDVSEHPNISRAVVFDRALTDKELRALTKG